LIANSLSIRLSLTLRCRDISDYLSFRSLGILRVTVPQLLSIGLLVAPARAGKDCLKSEAAWHRSFPLSLTLIVDVPQGNQQGSKRRNGLTGVVNSIYQLTGDDT
jgi:hypothetical protein